ncbi:MAG: hypothetical protein B7C24_11950, partial [Bacteroidetes bacterium 4572_77]
MKVFTLQRSRAESNWYKEPDSTSSGGKLTYMAKRFALLLLLMFSTSILFAQGVAIDHVFQTQPTGCDDVNGTFAIYATGGSGNYEYSIDDKATWVSSTDPYIVGGLGDGIVFNVWVRDADNISDEAPWDDNPAYMWNADAIYASAEYALPAGCYGESEGKVVLKVDASHSGGTTPYDYELFKSGVSQTTNQTGKFETLYAGTYTITATNDEGCSYTTGDLIVEHNNEILISSIVTDVTCHDDGDGVINATASDGHAPYQYELYLGATLIGSNNSGLFQNLDGGTYNLVVTDGFHCSNDDDIVVINPDELDFASVQSTNVSCFGFNDGEIAITMSGGTTDYTFYLNEGEVDEQSNNTGNFTGLLPDSYAVSVIDAHACITTYTSNPVVITEPTEFVLSHVATTNVETCYGDAGGSITMTTTGGTADYSYSIDGGTTWSTSAVFTGLYAGDYTLIAKDANDCSSTWVVDPIVITQPTQVVITSVTPTDVALCYGDLSGEIAIVASGGTGALSYSIDDGGTYQASGSFTGLAAGDYIVRVKDANDCDVYPNPDNNPYTINQPTQMALLSQSLVNPLCYGDANGEIHIT